MRNKYVMFLLICFCTVCLCRRPRPRPPVNGSSDGWIAVIIIMVPNIFAWLSLFIGTKLAKRPKVAKWIEGLNMPRFYPPAWLSLSVWTILYIAMGVASYLVYLACDGFTSEAALPLALYGFQLILNWTWVPVFYGTCKTSLGFFHFIALDIAVITCTISFFLTVKYTIYCMAPYLAFLAYLTIMSYLVWKNDNENSIKSVKL